MLSDYMFDQLRACSPIISKRRLLICYKYYIFDQLRDLFDQLRDQVGRNILQPPPLPFWRPGLNV